MKNKKLIAVLLVAVVVASVFSGCSSIGIDGTALMRPPKATGDKAEIQEVVENTAGGDYVLKYPQSGDYRSAIITQDLNDDGTEEAIVFYRGAGETTTTNILFISETDGKWTTKHSFKNPNAEIDKVYIGDIDGDGTKEVIVGWTSFVNGANQITYYKAVGDDVVEQTIDDTYSYLLMADLTNSGAQNVVILSLASEDQKKPKAVLYGYVSGKGFIKRSEIATNVNAVSYAKVQVGQIDSKHKGIFVDSTTVTGELVSEILYFDASTAVLKNPLNVKEDDGTITNVTTRKTAAVCRSIDAKDVLEVPVVSLLPGTPAGSTDTVCSMAQWCRLNIAKGSLIAGDSTVASYTDGYYFILPKTWLGNVTAFNSTETRTLKFYSITKPEPPTSPTAAGTEQSSEQPTAVATESQPAATQPAKQRVASQTGEAVQAKELLLTIQVYTERDWENEESNKTSEGFVMIKAESGLVYTAKLADKMPADLKINIGNFIKNFKLVTGS
ncbi:hypothetical protein AGMMS50284_2140 [Clostridia bacterium]|nr:hypothetical protein AGMMS50284_2140 [Clostridia bacterium]